MFRKVQSRFVSASRFSPRLFGRWFSSSPSFEHLRTERKGPAFHITLTRGELHNAFNEKVISELTDAMKLAEHEGKNGARCVVLTGLGKSFSAGADLAWMAKMAKYSESENRNDALALFDMFHSIHKCSLPVVSLSLSCSSWSCFFEACFFLSFFLSFSFSLKIARVNGPAFGGGVGIVAASDIAFSINTASFAFTVRCLPLSFFIFVVSDH
jgi:methylglutaconyl-CoA hydratase